MNVRKPVSRSQPHAADVLFLNFERTEDDMSAASDSFLHGCMLQNCVFFLGETAFCRRGLLMTSGLFAFRCNKKILPTVSFSQSVGKVDANAGAVQT